MSQYTCNCLAIIIHYYRYMINMKWNQHDLYEDLFYHNKFMNISYENYTFSTHWYLQLLKKGCWYSRNTRHTQIALCDIHIMLLANICITYRSPMTPNPSNLDFNLSRSLKVKYNGAGAPPLYGFILMFNSNILPNQAPLRDMTDIWMTLNWPFKFTQGQMWCYH